MKYLIPTEKETKALIESKLSEKDPEKRWHKIPTESNNKKSGVRFFQSIIKWVKS